MQAAYLTLRLIFPRDIAGEIIRWKGKIELEEEIREKAPFYRVVYHAGIHHVIRALRKALQKTQWRDRGFICPQCMKLWWDLVGSRSKVSIQFFNPGRDPGAMYKTGELPKCRCVVRGRMGCLDGLKCSFYKSGTIKTGSERKVFPRSKKEITYIEAWDEEKRNRQQEEMKQISKYESEMYAWFEAFNNAYEEIKAAKKNSNKENGNQE